MSTCRKESLSTTNVTKETVTTAVVTNNDRLSVEPMINVIAPATIDKSHGRSMSVVDLNELVNQRRPTASSSSAKLLVPEGGDELNETSYRDAEDNYQCLINDQNCPPVSNFSKSATSTSINAETVSSNPNSVPFTSIVNKDEGIVFATPNATTNKKTDIADVERYKMCGNSIII